MMRRALLFTALLCLGGLGQALDLQVPAATQDVQPGDLGVLPVSLSGGLGDRCEDASLSYTLPLGWTAVSPTRTLCLQGTETTLLAFQVPSDALAGEYPLELRLEGSSEPQVRTARVRVGEVADFLLLPTQSEVPYTGRPEVFPVELTNLGNAPDTYTLQVQGGLLLGANRVELKAGERRIIEVRFIPPQQGNGGSIVIEAQSVSRPELTSRKSINLGSRQSSTDPLELQRNRLLWSLEASGRASYADPSQSFSGSFGVGATLSGQLSNTANLFSSYRVQTQTGQAPTDALGIAVSTANAETRFNASFLGRNVRASQAFRLNGLSYFLGAGYQDPGQLYAQAGVQTTRFGASLTHTFPNLERSFEDRLSLNYGDQFDQLRLSAGLDIIYQDAIPQPWGYELNQAASFGDAVLFLGQNYRYVSRSDVHRLSFDARTRINDLTSVGGNAVFQLERNQLFYGLNGVVSFQPTEDWQTEVGGEISSLSSSAFWNLNYSPSFDWGRLAFTNRLGVQDGVLSERYSAGAQWKEQDFAATAYVQGSLNGLDGAGASLLYSPLEGYVAGASLTADLQRDWTYRFRANLGYQESDWQLEGRYQADWGATGSLQSSLGLSGALKIAPELAVRAAYSANLAGSSSVSLGVDSRVGSSFTTPSAVEELFGGSDIGQLEVVTFLDQNQNGIREADEQGASLNVAVNSGARLTNPQGVLNLELREGEYTINLAPDVAASYALGLERPPIVQIKRKQITQVVVPVREVVGVQGRAFVDVNRSGTLEESETPLPRAEVVLRGQGIERRVFTDSSGFYSIYGLAPGRYTVQIEALERAQTPPVAEITLERGQAPAQVNFAAAPTLAQNQQSFTQEDLTLEVVLPNEQIPAQGSFVIRVQTNLPSDVVTVSVGAQTLDMQPDSTRQTWQGRVTLPADAPEVLVVEALARANQQETTFQNFIRVNEALPLLRLSLNTRQALAGQLLEFTLVSFRSFEQAVLRLEDGSTVPLIPLANGRYGADLRAAQTPGDHQVTLVVDGQDIETVMYSVIDLALARASR